MSNPPRTPATPPPALAAAQLLLSEGLAAASRNDGARALELCRQAMAAAPDWALPHFMAGSEYACAQDWERAEAAFARAVLLDGSLRVARYQLGLLQFSSGRTEMAQVTWQPLLAADPAQDGLGDFVHGFDAVARVDFGEARRAFEAGLARPGVNPAVAADVREVLAQLALPPDDPAAPAGPLPQPQESLEPPAPAQPGHVLLSGYQRHQLH